MLKKLVSIFAVVMMVAIIVPVSMIDGDQNDDSNESYEGMFFCQSNLGKIEYVVNDDSHYYTSIFKGFWQSSTDKIKEFDRMIIDVKNGRRSVDDLVEYQGDWNESISFEKLRGKEVVQYSSVYTYKDEWYIQTFNGEKHCNEICIERTTHTYMMEPGHTMSIKIKNVSMGGALYWRVHDIGETTLLDVDKENSIYFTKTTWVDISAWTQGPYSSYGMVSADVCISGNSVPNSTPYALIAICILITIGVAAIMVYAGMKPKWSK